MKKRIFIAALAVALVCASVAAATPQEERKEQLNAAFERGMALTGEVAHESASILGNQPDAYIGKLFPSAPAHFTAGISTAATFVNSSFIKEPLAILNDAMNAASSSSGLNIGQTLNIPSTIPFPTAAASARIGGIFLPFDLGFFFFSTVPGMIKNVQAGDYKFDFDILTVGLDFRYAVYQGNVYAPKVSVGGGYIFTRSSVSFKSSFSTSGTYMVGGVPVSGTANATSSLDTKINTHTLFLDVQVSKTLLVFTPYLGFKTLLSAERSDCAWDYNIYATAGGIDREIEHNGNSFSIDNKFNFRKLSPQLFGGVGIKAGIVQFALNGAWNIRTNYLSAGLAVNIKI